MSERIPPWRRFPVGQVTVYVYTATLLLGTALFFFLHYLGNQIPYDLVQQRFAIEIEADPQFKGGVLSGRRDLGGDCQIALAVLAGAHRDAAHRPLVDAVLLKNFRREPPERWELWDLCAAHLAAIAGKELIKGIEKTRYWWGPKALSAIALRFLSVSELYRLILVAGFGAWLLLAAAVAPMGWWALLAVSPIIVFGMAFSNIAGFADIAHGISYAWAVLAAALLALLLRPVTARWAPWFCFVTGMTSSYLWFFDGHTTLALVLIGLVAWLGYERLGPSGEIRRAAGCVALYVAGFVLCFALGQVTKAVVHELTDGNFYLEGEVTRNFFGQASFHWNRMLKEATMGMMGSGSFSALEGCVSCQTGGSWRKLPMVREFRDFFLISPLDSLVTIVLMVFSVLAWASAAAVAIRQARHGRWKLARSILLLVALALLVLVQFLLPNDIDFRESRFVFLVLAMGWTCLVLAMMQLDRRGSSVLAVCLVGGLLAGAAAAKPVAGWWLDRTLATTRHIIQSDFDVYLDKDGNRLIYVRDECSGADFESGFYLHVFPVDFADLLSRRSRLSGYQQLDFRWEYFGVLTGGRCFLVRNIPDYDVAVIRTGQYHPDKGRIWGASAVLFDRNLSQN